MTTQLELHVLDVNRRLSELAAEVDRLQKPAEALREASAGLSVRAASLVVSDEAYDALVERPDAAPAPKRAPASHDARRRQPA
jgi:hypothetical protein